MTKKDYILVAKAIKNHYETWANYYSDYEPNVKLGYLVQDLANTLARDNSRFDRQRFLTACGIE